MAGWIELLLPLFLASPVEPPPEGYCVHCHVAADDPSVSAPAKAVAESVHAELEHPCVACHGGDVREPTLRAHDESRGFRGKVSPKDVPWLCGGCHSDAAFIRRYSASLSVDQLPLYRSSDHGRALARGEERVATCISCHGDHGIRRVSDAKAPVHPLHVAETCGQCHADPKHPAYRHSKRNPVEEWKKSVHAKALLEDGDSSAPTCNDCHGDHGAAPPGVGDIHRACGSCHAEQSERFQKSPHQTHYDKLGFGECAECHGRHDVEQASDAMFGRGGRGVCKRCHAEDDPGQKRGDAIRARLKAAADRSAEARARLERAKRTGLSLPEAELEERELVTALRKLRIAVHTLDLEALEPGMKSVDESSSRIIDAVQKAEAELEVERRGYAVFILLLLLMTGLLWLKLRRLTR